MGLTLKTIKVNLRKKPGTNNLSPFSPNLKTMKKIFLLILSLSFTLIGISQPVITASNIPLIGDNVTIAICSDQINPGNSGANQTWDFSGLTEMEEQSFLYVDPANTPKADSFPNANLCGISWDGSYSYYNVSSNALAVEGYFTPIPPSDTALFVFDNREKIVQLPYTYNDNFMDDFDGINYVPNVGALAFDGSIDSEADSYGTLILPNGTYTNVVRYHFNRSQTNYFNGFPANTQTKEQWAWVSADYRFWLLLMEENFDGVNTTQLVWYDKNPYSTVTGISPFDDGQKISVFPNPIKAGTDMNIIWDKNEQAILSIHSMDGKVIYEKKWQLNNGVNTLNLPRLTAGIFHLKIRAKSRNYNHKISLY